MAVYCIEMIRNYPAMSNYPFWDISLSLKEKGGFPACSHSLKIGITRLRSSTVSARTG